MRVSWVHTLAAASLVLAGSACGDDETAVPTTDDLVDRAVTVEDLGADWQSSPESEPQVVTDEARADLATLDLCPDASEDDQEFAAGLEWQVGSGAGFVGDTVGTFTPALIEVLLADEPDEVTDIFETLRDGMTMCVPGEVSLPDAGNFTVTALEVPEVGEDRFGVWYQQTDQPEGNDRWDIRHVLVRDGAVLMWLSEIEINPTSETIVDQSTFDDVVVAAASQLSD